MSCSAKRTRKVAPSRDFDVYYDRTLLLPTHKDYYREMNRAVAITSKFIIQPKFDAMFSDIRPRQNIVTKPTFEPQVSPFDKYYRRPHTLQPLDDVSGSNRVLYFKQPVRKQQPRSALRLKPEPWEPVDEASVEPDAKNVPKTPSFASKTCQTDYREMETQTKPWAHDVITTQDAELLSFHWLTVGASPGSIGSTEIALIKREWEKQTWEAALPPISVKKGKKHRRMTVALLSNHLWAREKALEAVHEQRLQLSAGNLQSAVASVKEELARRLQRLFDWSVVNNAGKKRYLRHQLMRALRKLKNQEQEGKKTIGRNMSVGPVTLEPDVRTLLQSDRSGFSRASAQMRPRFLMRYSGFDVVEKRVALSAKPAAGFNVDIHSKPKRRDNYCSRGVTLFQQGIDDLHLGVKGLQISEDVGKQKALPFLLNPRGISNMETPVCGSPPSPNEEELLHILLLQKIIEGRFAQIRGGLSEDIWSSTDQ